MARFIVRMAVIVPLALAVGISWPGDKERSLSQESPPSDFTPPIFTLRVNRQDNVDTVQGAPIIFTVFLSGSTSVNPLRIGKADSPWHTHLRLELVDGKPIPWSVYPIGIPQSFLLRRDALGQIDFDEKEGDEAVLDAERNYTAEFGIDPEESAKIPAGSYTVQAALDVPFVGSRKRVVSPPVVISVRELKKTPLTADQELRQLIESVEFYLKAGRFEDAHRLALQVKERQPKKIRSYILLGDALNGLRRDREALEAYDEAFHLSAVEKQYEPPTYLIMRRHEIEQRLGKQ